MDFLFTVCLQSVFYQSQQLIDGSRSFDPDGTTPSYSWLCNEIVSGNPCLVLKENSTQLERADVAFRNYSDGKGSLNFPAKLFSSDLLLVLLPLVFFAFICMCVNNVCIIVKGIPNMTIHFPRINVTMVMSSGNRLASKSVKVFIKNATNPLPLLFIRPIKTDQTDGSVPTNRILRLKAYSRG